LSKPDTLPSLLDPVGGRAEVIGLYEVPGEGADHGDVWALIGERGSDLLVRRQNRVDVRRVKTITDLEALDFETLGREELCEGGYGVDLTGDDQLRGLVDGCQRDQAGGLLKQGEDLLRCGVDSIHGTVWGERLHQTSPGGDQGTSVGFGENAGDMGSGQFADRMADEQVGAEAQGFKEAE
jgi:hypothetical protein